VKRREPTDFPATVVIGLDRPKSSPIPASIARRAVGSTAGARSVVVAIRRLFIVPAGKSADLIDIEII
jgi:hypothetical protein